MPPSRAAEDADPEELAKAFLALSSGTRLELLRCIREPRPARDIVVRPRRHGPGQNPDRPVSSQTLRTHLKKLMDAGLVTEVGTAGQQEFVANRPRLYALAEAFRELSMPSGSHRPASDLTQKLEERGKVAPVRGPRLVLVHGAYEGRAYALSGDIARDSAWEIGRKQDVAVRLDYDPFVSRVHARVSRDPTGFQLRDLPESHNGTFVNWQPVPKNTTVPLRPGDVIGVGRSLLVFSET